MRHDHATDGAGIQRQESPLVDAVSRNGVDPSAPWRAHLRQLTMARQAAEQRHARPAMQAGLGRWEQTATAQERAVALHVELGRITALHRAWLHDQGEDVHKATQMRTVVGTVEPHQ